jgi:hypothetical protein
LKKQCLILLLLVAGLPAGSNSQPKDENSFVKWTTWMLVQAIPSPTFAEDRNSTDTRLKFGLEWQVIPLSVSFGANEYVSPLSSFFIRPVKRFSGSAEIFFQPALAVGDYKYAQLNKFSYKTGARLVLPVSQKGEYLAVSLGAGYYSQKKIGGELNDGVTYEAGLYTMFGMLGLKFNYNQNAESRYNITLYIKYY